MRQAQTTIEVRTRGQGLTEITGEVDGWVAGTGIRQGLLSAFIRHTSASLTIQENADPDVQRDLQAFFKRLVPEDDARYVHTVEGPDDMPAHIRAVLTGVSLTIPVSGGHPELGTWQGIYVFEHRARPHARQVVLHLVGD